MHKTTQTTHKQAHYTHTHTQRHITHIHPTRMHAYTTKGVLSVTTFAQTPNTHTHTHTHTHTSHTHTYYVYKVASVSVPLSLLRIRRLLSVFHTHIHIRARLIFFSHFCKHTHTQTERCLRLYTPCPRSTAKVPMPKSRRCISVTYKCV